MNDKSLKGERAAESGPVSRRELDRLRARREVPTPTLDYKFGEPSGSVMRKLDVVRARRAHEVESRLRTVEGRAESGFALAGVSGRAKRDFERTR